MERNLLTNVSLDDVARLRIHRLRKKRLDSKASLCSQRALLYTESFKQTENEPYILRKAKAFAHTLDHMSIFIEADSLIFGNMASKNFAAPIYPEYSMDWLADEVDTFSLRKGDVFQVDEKVKADLLSISDFWLGNTHKDEVKRNLTDDIRLASKTGALHLGGISMSGDGHIVPDYPTLLSRGFRWYVDEANIRLDEIQSYERKSFYQAVIISLEAALRWIKQYGDLAGQLSIEENGQRKVELLDMAKMAMTLMERPAQSFRECVQATYLVHILQLIESNGHSFCFGRFDQYAYPYYRRDVQKGVLNESTALEIITHFFLMTNSTNKIRPNGHTKFSQGYPLYSNLMIGGLTPEGEDATNALSSLCIEAMNLTALKEPNFAMRYHQDTPADLLKLAAKLIRSGTGMPAMFNDAVAIRGLTDLGIPIEDARDYCAIGCVETGVAGKYGHRATGMTYCNWGKLLEMLVNNGVDPNTNIQQVSINGQLGSDIEFSSYDQLWQGWRKILKYYTDLAVESDVICDRSLVKFDASPLASCFIQNAFELGKTLKEGGCKYDIISQSNIGPSVVGNSLYTMKKLIFDDHKLTLNQLKSALSDNWQSLDSAKIHKMVRQLSKYGNDIDEVDDIVANVFESYLELLPSYKTERSGNGPVISRYTMSTSNITAYVPNGLEVGATPDGRFAQQPLNEGCSPTQGTDTHGPTAVLKSVSKLPNHQVAAGQLLNMRFTPSSLSKDEDLDKFIDLLRTSVELNIYHNQFNIVDTKTLRDAQRYPQLYSDLMVRVAGYCAQFISLMPEAQEAIISRSEHGYG
ncbi:MAG: formate C-acetyltransferase/glycerol dehydratase family glycyl radical enzyme [Erysipelotrichaceae bacterium]|nr:formate C-acetyltransferase/glycerol dehydratase family glycyl radical enzyme [Erysipelotrichaceae bacterium]